MEYGYIRVSTREQNEQRQLIAMQEFGISEKRIYMDKQSGKDFERKNYKKMVRKLKKDDTLVVKSIDRLGRNYEEILEQWRIITKEKQAAIVVLDMPLLDTRQNRDLTGTLIADIALQLLSYAKQFYEEAFHFIEEKFGAENVISAVMHADEINVAATEELGKEVYHYHLHAMVLPVVEKEILWSKRCKDEKLRGTVKEVVHQISHSKKWKSDIPLTDEKGNPLLRKNGKPMFRASYSILQNELFNYMTEREFKGFQRGEYGSTAEHLTSLQYQIKQDKERLEKLQKRIQREQMKYEPARNVSKTYNEIDSMGQKKSRVKWQSPKRIILSLLPLPKRALPVVQKSAN